MCLCFHTVFVRSVCRHWLCWSHIGIADLFWKKRNHVGLGKKKMDKQRKFSFPSRDVEACGNMFIGVIFVFTQHFDIQRHSRKKQDEGLLEEAMTSWEFEHTITGEYEIISPFYRTEVYRIPETKILGGFFLVEQNGMTYTVWIKIGKDVKKTITIDKMEGNYEDV